MSYALVEYHYLCAKCKNKVAYSASMTGACRWTVMFVGELHLYVVCLLRTSVHRLQWKIINSVLIDGRDNCVVMATGGCALQFSICVLWLMMFQCVMSCAVYKLCLYLLL